MLISVMLQVFIQNGKCLKTSFSLSGICTNSSELHFSPYGCPSSHTVWRRCPNCHRLFPSRVQCSVKSLHVTVMEKNSHCSAGTKALRLWSQREERMRGKRMQWNSVCMHVGVYFSWWALPESLYKAPPEEDTPVISLGWCWCRCPLGSDLWEPHCGTATHRASPPPSDNSIDFRQSYNEHILIHSNIDIP